MNHPNLYPPQQAYPLSWVEETGQAVQISIHQPSPFICTNLERVLPSWKQQLALWVVIVLQRSQHSLLETTLAVETEKEQLREKFMRFGCDVIFNLRDRGFVTDLFDPRTGYPLLSLPGEIPHDDTAVVKVLLGFPVIHNQCRVLKHPKWGTAVYPSILMSTAAPTILKPVLGQVAAQQGWCTKTKSAV